MLGEGGVIVESNGLAQRGFDAGEDRQHDRNGFGGGFSDEPRCERDAGFALMENGATGRVRLQMMRSPSQ